MTINLGMDALGRVTLGQLLDSCPDEQITRMKTAWKALAAGEWKDAAHHLRNAGSEGDSPWHERCNELADEYEAMPSRKA